MKKNKRLLTRADLIPQPVLLIKPLKKINDEDLKVELNKKISKMKNIYDF